MDRGTERVFDEYLVILSQAGSRTAFDRLARRWTPRLLRFVSRAVGADTVIAPRDVVQETWLGAIHSLGRLEDPAGFAPWIYSIARRKCADALRARVRRRRLAASTLAQDASPIEAGSCDVEQHLDLADAIARLPPDERSLVHLFYAADMSIDEVAAALEIPPGTAKSRLHRIRATLRRCLQEDKKGEDDGRAR